MQELITRDMKVDQALTRFPQTLDVFVSYGFKPLKNPLLRRTFAPLMTIQGAAKMQHFDDAKLERFMHELNARAVLGGASREHDEESPLYDLRDVDGLRAQNIVVTPALVEVDNRGLEPPEPMVRILAIAQQLAPGQRLEALNERQPMLLYPKLEELGLQHHTEQMPAGHYRITVTRPASEPSAKEA